MSHTFQICPIIFALHGDSVPHDIFSCKTTDIGSNFNKESY